MRSSRRTADCARSSAARATTMAIASPIDGKVSKTRTLANGLQRCQPPATIRPPRPSPMSHKPKTVLIVDDDEGMRDTLTAILKREYRVLRVASGEAALPLLTKDDVDLVLLDVRLPGISGFEVLRIIKENYSLVEVIMISAINEIATAV